MTYLEMCKEGSVEPKDWKRWLDETKKDGDRENELLGLLPEEYEDLKNGVRTMAFYVFKRRHLRSIHNIWGGCYVRYLFEYEGSEPHFETGWVDAVSNSQGFCKIQCDDEFSGGRAVTVRTIDVMEILPHKERPMVYYKTMVCGQCDKCDHMANEEPRGDCPNYQLMNALWHKQKGDAEFIKLYDRVNGRGGCDHDGCDHDGCHCDGCQSVT